MIMMYTRKQYAKLFNLVYVEDKAHPQPLESRTIAFKDLKIFMDTSAGMLSISSADVGKVLKDVDAEQLDFDTFSDLIQKMIRGKSISVVVHAFEEAKRIRLESRMKAYQKFEGTAGPAARKGAAGTASPGVPAEEPSKPADKKSEVTKTTDIDIFSEAFALMDSRGGGVLSLDNVYEFCEALPDPPAQSVVRKLYNQFDEDGSGDIDSDEFLGFCQALEKAVGTSVADMLAHFTKAMYKRLFELVDEGGDSNAMVSKDELKMLLEAISPLLSSKFSANDVINVIRDYPGELDFNNFCDVVKKLTVGKSISQVVTAFEEAKRRRKAAKHYAMQRFQESGPRSGIAVDRGGESGGGQRSLCFMCVEKDEQIRELQDIIAQLEGGKDDAPARAPTVATIRRDEDEPHGDPWEELHSLNRVVATSSWLRKFPEYVKAAVHSNKSSRINEMANFYLERARGAGIDTDAVARTVNDAVAEHDEHVSQMRAVADVCMMEIREFHRHADEMLNLMRSQAELDRPKIEEALDHMSILRERCQAMRSDADWLIDSLAERRTDCATKALCVAPYTNKSQKLVQLVLDAEDATQRLLDMGTVMNMYGSDQLLDIEIFAKRMLSGAKTGVTPEEVERLTDSTAKTLGRLTPDDWNTLFGDLSKSMVGMARAASTTQSMRKEKAIMTQPVVDLTPLQRLQKKGAEPVPGATDDDRSGNGADYTPNVRMRSSSPRVRQMKTTRPRDAVAHVDRIVQQYVLKSGEDAPPLPANFHRVEPGSNTFVFGTKKIEVIPVDRSACVKVGGGYLMFDEFVRKYSQQEARRFVVRESAPTTPRTTVTQSGTPSYGRTPRSNTPGVGSRTPRTIVRSSHGGVKIV